jgi:hypothetical protein
MKSTKFTFAMFGVLLFSLSGWASDKMTANIQIYQTVHIGSSELAPGEYKMTWTESQSNAEVTISQDKRVIATVPARVAQQRSGYSSPVLHTDSVSHALTEIDLPKVSISFGSENPAPPSPSN